MGLSELHYYDLYGARGVGGPEVHARGGQQHILAAMAPLGPEYVGVLTRAFSALDRSVPSPGKRSGAYSNGGAYDVIPYMLLNYNGKYDDVSTLAHELGHTMQSHLSNKSQPYATASYPTFVAEVASTFNESLLIDHMLKRISDPKARRPSCNYLEGIKGTASVRRSSPSSNWECTRWPRGSGRHRRGAGEALHGHHEEVRRPRPGRSPSYDYVAHEWSFIPHFYRDFYVFQYATSFTASEALRRKSRPATSRPSNVSAIPVSRRLETDRPPRTPAST